MNEPENRTRARLLVNTRGIEIWIDTLHERAITGDRVAGQALDKLEEALATCAGLCNDGPEFTEQQYVAIFEGLKIIKQAACGHSDYPLEVLRSVGEQVVKDCESIGTEPPDISFLYKGLR